MSIIVNGIEFPTRVWFESENGWASREPTTNDVKRRKCLARLMKREITLEEYFEAI